MFRQTETESRKMDRSFAELMGPTLPPPWNWAGQRRALSDTSAAGDRLVNNAGAEVLMCLISLWPSTRALCPGLQWSLLVPVIGGGNIHPFPDPWWVYPLLICPALFKYRREEISWIVSSVRSAGRLLLSVLLLQCKMRMKRLSYVAGLTYLLLSFYSETLRWGLWCWGAE